MVPIIGLAVPQAPVVDGVRLNITGSFATAAPVVSLTVTVVVVVAVPLATTVPVVGLKVTTKGAFAGAGYKVWSTVVVPVSLYCDSVAVMVQNPLVDDVV